MGSTWVSNSGGVNQVKRLLEYAGIPLELQVAEICNAFCLDAQALHPNEASFFSRKIIYSGSEDIENCREIDRIVQIFEEPEVSQIIGAQLSLNIPIECKYRKDVEIFAFNRKEKNVHKRFPLYSDAKGSQLFNLLGGSRNIFSKMDISDLVFVEIKNGETPNKVFDENLVYNAAGALYDFALFDLSADAIGRSEYTFRNKLIDELELKTTFENYLSETHYFWEQVIHTWIANISDIYIEKFNRAVFQGGRIYCLGITAVLPIICINGPIYNVSWNSTSGIEEFQEAPYCLTVIRKRGWPGLAISGLMNRTPEVPVIITNPGHLRDALDIGLKWYYEIRKILLETPTELVDRYSLEAAFFYQTYRSYTSREAFQSGYRSDLNFDP